MSSNNKSDLVRLLVASCMIGFAIAALFLGVLVWFEVLGIQNLLSTVMGCFAMFSLWVLNGIAFSVLQLALILGRDDDDDDHDGGHFAREFLAEPVPIRVDRPKHRHPPRR